MLDLSMEQKGETSGLGVEQAMGSKHIWTEGANPTGLAGQNTSSADVIINIDHQLNRNQTRLCNPCEGFSRLG